MQQKYLFGRKAGGDQPIAERDLIGPAVAKLLSLDVLIDADQHGPAATASGRRLLLGRDDRRQDRGRYGQYQNQMCQETHDDTPQESDDTFDERLETEELNQKDAKDAKKYKYDQSTTSE